MLKLTQYAERGTERTVYVAAHHIVALYPHPSGKGCFVEMSTSCDDDGGSLLHVVETAADVARMCEGQ